MEIFINDQKLDDAGGDEPTVQDALVRIQESHCPPAHIVMGIMCDGEPVPGGEMADALVRRTVDIQRLDVITSTKEALVADAMVQASATLEDTEGACQRVAELVSEGKSQEAVVLLGQCLSVWQQIHEAVAKSIAMLDLDTDGVTIRDEPLDAVIGKPKGVLLQMKSALESQDHVLLADILQYEFSEVTDSWHSVITMLRTQAEQRLSKMTAS